MQFQVWLQPDWQRAFPADRPGSTRRLELWAARGERVAFQVCVRHDHPGILPVTIAVQAPAGLQVQVRRVGSVPVAHHTEGSPLESRDGRLPGFVPDVLFPTATARAPAGEVLAFWVTVEVAPSATAGRKTIRLAATLGEGKTCRTERLSCDIQVAPVTLQRRRDFHVTHWFYADALADWYGVAPFSKGFWPICARYMRNVAEHGGDTIYVPVFTPPLDGVKRPTQLLHVTRLGKDRYRFDWRAVRQWIKTAKAAGITHFEWAHLFTQWGVKYALRIYHEQGGDERLLWPSTTGATSPTYRKFLAQFLPALKQFLDHEGLLKNSFFHLSDEPHGAEALEGYRAARKLLRELAPWMQVMDALSDIEYGRQKLTDIPIPSIRTALDFKAEGIPSWCYYCCSPTGRFTNRFLDTPLPNVRAQGWLFYRHGFGGFLHWGYNYWYLRQTRRLIDPFAVSDAHAWPGWAYGDPFMVYPGGGVAGAGGPGSGEGHEDGPLDSIRWEVFAAGLQDYALLQTLGVEPSDKRLRSFQTFEEFPRAGRAIPALRAALLSTL
ncbi:MAG: DUF4091 domain-containing protein [Planctomycetota bacterium]